MIAAFLEQKKKRMKMREKLDKKGTSNNFLPQHDDEKKNTRENC